jgi:hypothetical protein
MLPRVVISSLIIGASASCASQARRAHETPCPHMYTPLSIAVRPDTTARGTIRGIAHVKDAKDPVWDILVSVENSQLSAKTDRSGAFLISGVSTGTAVVIVRHLGFSPASARVAFEGSEQGRGVFLDVSVTLPCPVS